MRVIFTCGGTAGHVNPALALAGYMKEKDPETAVLFVGTPTGMERELGLPKSDRLDVRQYIYDMDVVMAAADVVLCRAGASTISELTALGKPTVMVPSPYVTNNHQEKNARLLEKHGGAVVITEPESTGDGLYKAVEAILSDNEKCISMARAMKELGIPDATARIYDTVMALVRK